MVFRTEKYEMSTANQNLISAEASNDVLKIHSDENSKGTSAASGVQLSGVVAASLGLIFLLQTALNIYLSAALFSQPYSLNEEKDHLKINLENETYIKNLTSERDELKGMLNDLKRNKLKEIKFEIEGTKINLTEERDELGKTLKEIVSQNNNLTEERDELKRIKFGIEATSRNLTAQRDDLRKTLQSLNLQHRAAIEERENLTTVLKNLGQQGWMLFGGSAYYVSSTTKTWEESRNYCHQKGADLIIINSKEEQNFANQLKKYSWIGLTDSENEGTWKWVDGTQLSTSYWGPNEPNGNKGENCGDIKTFDAERSWNDEQCSLLHSWICEIRLPQ